MSKKWNPGKKTVELHGAARPSRIRRDPVRPDKLADLAKKIDWGSREWEIRLAVIGIILFAIALNALIFGIGLTSH